MDDEVLHGGVANAGAVVRSGRHVLRPSNQHSATIHRLLDHVRADGFDGASEPVAIEGDRERLVFVAGDVPTPPYPEWFRDDHALASTTRLIRRFHDASTGFDRDGATWSDELADPVEGDVICHNDVCPENIVFRDGAATALLDFDFAAPGRRSHDVAAFARMCVPIDDPVNAARLGWEPVDGPRRLRLVTDAYGLSAAMRTEVMGRLDDTIAHGGEFVLRRVEAGEQPFIEMLELMGGVERFDRRRTWWAAERSAFAAALT